MGKVPPLALNAQGISLYLPISLKTTDTSKILATQALIDSDATGTFLNWSLVEKHQMNIWKLSQPILVFNVDRTPIKLDKYLKWWI